MSRSSAARALPAGAALVVTALALLASCQIPGKTGRAEKPQPPAAGEPNLAAVPARARELFQAAERGELDEVQRLVEKRPSLLQAADGYGWTAASYAAWRGRKAVYDYLTARGAPTDLFTESALGPFPRFVERLQARPASVRQRDPREGATPLVWAARAGNREGCEYLLAQGAEIDAADREGGRPLSYAVAASDLELAQLLLRAGADPKATDLKGRTPLHLAAGAGSYELVSLLAERGASLDAADAEGNTPLHLAAAAGSFEVCEYLLARGAPLEVRNRKGQTPRDAALQNGHEKIALLLKEKP
jgi:ankyrin repeat protein